MRLHKYIAHTGYCSRRKAETLISEGKVKVNGNLVKNTVTIVNPDVDIIHIDGEIINKKEEKVYYIMNKPRGVISSYSDDRGRRTVVDLMNNINARIYPIGRLDYNTSGLLLLTNDGELTNKILHPSNKIYKTYYATIEGNVDINHLEEMKNGVNIDGYKTAPSIIIPHYYDRKKNVTKIELKIYEGRNRQIRKMFELYEYKVKYLKRVAIGEIQLKNLKVGEYRELTNKELRYLKYNIKKNDEIEN